MNYIVIECTADGVSVTSYDEDRLQDMLTEHDNVDFVKDFDEIDPNYWDGKIMIIKGDIVVPKPKRVITKFALE
jgi:hypothetical protein